MTVVLTSTQTSWVNGDGVRTQWSYNFDIQRQSDVEVVIQDVAGLTIETITTNNFALVPNASSEDSGGYVVYPVVGTPLSAAYKLRLRRTVPYEQDANFSQFSRFSGSATEKTFDRLVMMIQQLSEGLDRTVQAPRDQDGYTILPGTAGQAVIYDDTTGVLKPGVLTSSGVSTPYMAGLQASVDDAAEMRTALSLIVRVATRAALKALDTTKDFAAALTEGVPKVIGRFGIFDWIGTDLSATISKAVTVTACNAGTDTATAVAHGLYTGDCVILPVAANGLSASTKYYVIKTTDDAFKLATSYANAVNNVAVDLTGTAAFNGTMLVDPLEGWYVIPNGKAINGSEGAWKRRADTFRPEHFGLNETGDDGPVYYSTLRTAAAADLSPTVDFGSGFGVLGSDVRFFWVAAGTDQKIVVRGDGDGAARIRVPASNTSGEFLISLTNHRQQIDFTGIAFLSEHVAGSANYHKGVHITNTTIPGGAGWGTKLFTQANVKNIRVASLQNGSTGQWYRPLRVSHMWNPVVAENWCYSHTGINPNTATNIDDGSGVCCGLELFQCYNAIVEKNQVGGKWRYGIRVHGAEAPDFEDGRILNNTVFGRPETGIAFEHTNAAFVTAPLLEVGFYVHGNHINALKQGIYGVGTRQIRITDNYDYAAYTDASGLHQYPTAAGIELYACSDFVITGNQFCENGFWHDINDANRNILIGENCRQGYIGPNQQGTIGLAIWIHVTATGIVVDEQLWGVQASGAIGNLWTPTIRISGPHVFLGETVASIMPALQFGGASVGITYTNLNGGYCRIGKQVTWWLTIALSSKGTSTGTARIVTGLPAPAASSQFSANIGYSNAFTGAGAPDGGLMNTGSSIIELYRRAASNNQNSQTLDTDFGNTTAIRMSGSYFTD